MGAEFLKKLLSPETSAEERDVMCATAFGRTFAESVGELRIADFLDGLKSRRYMPTRVGAQAPADDEKEKTVEIEFVLLRECWDMSDPVFALYECDGGLLGSAWRPSSAPRFTAVFAGDDGPRAQFAAMKCMKSYYEVF